MSEKNGRDDGQECHGGRRESVRTANPTNDLLDSITRIPDNFLFDLSVLGTIDPPSSRGSFRV